MTQSRYMPPSSSQLAIQTCKTNLIGDNVYKATTPCLHSRRSFITSTKELSINETPANARTTAWRSQFSNYSCLTTAVQPPTESLPPGHVLSRTDWCVLNRARTVVGRTGDNMVKWGLSTKAECPCGEEVQTMSHCLQDCTLSTHCNTYDLQRATPLFCSWLNAWRDKILSLLL